VLVVSRDISARLAAEEALRATMHRLRRQNSALAEQARSPELLDARYDKTLRMITALAAETLEAARVSVWFYNDERTKIRCADLYEANGHRHTAGVELTAADYPAYFQALAEERTIAADTAATDPRTREFSPHYLEAHGITSLLDAPIRGGGRMVGIICHEHTGPPRVWKPDEQSFAGSMADLVALSLEVAQRREAEAALREAHASLEVKVAERTRDLESANERLQELDRLKSEFLATMSHELRTPLNSIIGFTGILRQGLAGPLNDEQLKQLGMVHSSARHLLGLINDLLDLSRIESGRLELFHETFRVSDLVTEVVQSLTPLIEQKKLRLESSLNPPDLTLHSDRKRCFQVLLNLANNAVKFTEVGLVRLAVYATPETVEMAVTDTGVGIKPENMTRLFEAFRQGDGSARRVYEGTGLGLYLSKQLATMLGGHIKAESEFGIGSRFTFSVPRTFSPVEPTS
jgi:signal transduction histidine kinase